MTNEEQDAPSTDSQGDPNKKVPAPTKEDMKKVVSSTEEKSLKPEGVRNFEKRTK